MHILSKGHRVFPFSKPCMTVAFFILSLFLLTTTAKTDRRVVKFENDENETVDDLHVVMKNDSVDVEWSNTSPFDSERVDETRQTHNFYGASVPEGGSAKVTFTSPAGTPLGIDQWWWTKGGDPENDGTRVGLLHSDNGGRVLSVTGGSASGDGQISVAIGGLSEIFETTAGSTPIETLIEFIEFLEGFVTGSDTLIYCRPQLSDNMVMFLGNLQGDPSNELNAQILSHDSGQHLRLVPLGTGLPTLTEWGLIIFAGLFIASLIFMLRRKRARQASQA